MSDGAGPDDGIDKLARERLWVKSSVVVTIALACVAGSVMVFKACVELPQTLGTNVIDRAASALETVVSAFSKGTVTTSFVSYSTRLESMQRLQIGSVTQMELFSRTDERTFAYVPLPEIVVEARAPIEYTYYVDLKKEWRFVLEEGMIRVHAPKIEFNTPSVDVSAIQYEVRSGTFGTEKVLEDLRKSMMFLAKEKARDNVHLVQETGRAQVREFVEVWLRKSFKDGEGFPVEVRFEGEERSDSAVLEQEE